MTVQEGRWKCTHKMIDFSKHLQSHGIHEIFPLHTKKEYKDHIEIHVLLCTSAIENYFAQDWLNLINDFS